MAIKYNTDRNKFPLRLHRWKTFIISFHRDNFCYSGRCDCHDQDFDGKKMPYELLAGKIAEYVEKVLVDGEEHHVLKHVMVKD